jgi:hypothetical protein
LFRKIGNHTCFVILILLNDNGRSIKSYSNILLFPFRNVKFLPYESSPTQATPYTLLPLCRRLLDFLRVFAHAGQPLISSCDLEMLPFMSLPEGIKSVTLCSEVLSVLLSSERCVLSSARFVLSSARCYC